MVQAPSQKSHFGSGNPLKTALWDSLAAVNERTRKRIEPKRRTRFWPWGNERTMESSRISRWEPGVMVQAPPQKPHFGSGNPLKTALWGTLVAANERTKISN